MRGPEKANQIGTVLGPGGRHLFHGRAKVGEPCGGGFHKCGHFGVDAGVAKITKDQVRQIAETKLQDLNARDIDQAAKIIEGTARSMGVEVG